MQKRFVFCFFCAMEISHCG